MAIISIDGTVQAKGTSEVNGLPGTITGIEGEPLTHAITYTGKRRELLGTEYRVQVVPRDGGGADFYVAEVPQELQQEISEIVKTRFGEDKEPVFTN